MTMMPKESLFAVIVLVIWLFHDGHFDGHQVVMYIRPLHVDTDNNVASNTD